MFVPIGSLRCRDRSQTYIRYQYGRTLVHGNGTFDCTYKIGDSAQQYPNNCITGLHEPGCIGVAANRKPLLCWRQLDCNFRTRSLALLEATESDQYLATLQREYLDRIFMPLGKVPSFLHESMSSGGVTGNER